MKKIITLLAAALVAALPFAVAAEHPDAKVQSREYKLSGFRSLDISWSYRVELTQSGSYSVRVEAPESLMEYLDIRVADGTLKLGVKGKISGKKFDLSQNEVRVYISMPGLSALEMSGASRLTASGQFNARGEFKLDMSGSTQASGLNIKADEVEIDCSGASKFDLSGNFDKLELDMSGAGTATLNGNVGRAEMELSGAAKLNQNGKIGTLEMEATGASKYNLNGSLGGFALEASGAAKVNTLDAPADRVSVRLSGAANASVDVRQELSVNLSGAAGCRYRAGAKLRITNQTIARGASLTQL